MLIFTVVSTAVSLFITFFPIYFQNYLYIDTSKKYISFKVFLYKFIPLVKINNVENHPFKMQINDKENGFPVGSIPKNFKKILKYIDFERVVQLGVYGISDGGAALPIFQWQITNILYEVIAYYQDIKLKNYIILNENDEHTKYFLKLSASLNLFKISMILMIILGDKINEFKANKNKRKHRQA